MCNFSKTKRKIIAKHPETTALKDIDAAEKKLSNAVTKRLSNKKEKINFDLNIYFIHSLYPSWNTEFRNVETINTLFIKKNSSWRLGRQSVKKPNKFRIWDIWKTLLRRVPNRKSSIIIICEIV